MKNIKQTIQFPLHALINPEIPVELRPEVKAQFDAERLEQAPPEELAVAREALMAKMPEKVKHITTRYGATSVTDYIPVTLEVGNVIYDIFYTLSDKPESPLRRRALEKKLQELADILVKDEFNFPEFAKVVVKKVLENDELWTKQEYNAYVEVDGEKRFFTINDKGMNYYKNISDALVAEFE